MEVREGNTNSLDGLRQGKSPSRLSDNQSEKTCPTEWIVILLIEFRAAWDNARIRDVLSGADRVVMNTNANQEPSTGQFMLGHRNKLQLPDQGGSSKGQGLIS